MEVKSKPVEMEEPTVNSTLSELLKSKTVSFLPGVCLLVNAMSGPAIPFSAILFEYGGWLPVVLIYFTFATLSTLSSLFIVEAMQAIPGNKHFQGTVEFATLVNFYFGKKMHIAAQFCIYAAIQSNAIQCIVLTAQTFDNILIDLFGTTCGLTFQNGRDYLICVSDKIVIGSSPFGNIWMVVTIGYLMVILFTMPFLFINLNDNILMQVVTFLISIVICIEWVATSLSYKLSSGTDWNPIETVSSNAGQIVGTIMLSLSFTYVVPSWINLKKRNVNIQTTLWSSSLVTMSLYIIIGIIPALTLPKVLSSNDGSVLSRLANFSSSYLLTKISIYAFSLVMLLPSIPVLFIVSNDNLVQNDIFNTRISRFLTYILPWIITMLLGSSIEDFQIWTSLLFVSTSNYIVPSIIYLKCNQFRQKYNKDRAVLTQKQKNILKKIHFQSQAIKLWIDYKKEGGQSDFQGFYKTKRKNLGKFFGEVVGDNDQEGGPKQRKKKNLDVFLGEHGMEIARSDRGEENIAETSGRDIDDDSLSSKGHSLFSQLSNFFGEEKRESIPIISFSQDETSVKLPMILTKETEFQTPQFLLTRRRSSVDFRRSGELQKNSAGEIRNFLHIPGEDIFNKIPPLSSTPPNGSKSSIHSRSSEKSSISVGKALSVSSSLNNDEGNQNHIIRKNSVSFSDSLSPLGSEEKIIFHKSLPRPAIVKDSTEKVKLSSVVLSSDGSIDIGIILEKGIRRNSSQKSDESSTKRGILKLSPTKVSALDVPNVLDVSNGKVANLRRPSQVMRERALTEDSLTKTQFPRNTDTLIQVHRDVNPGSLNEKIFMRKRADTDKVAKSQVEANSQDDASPEQEASKDLEKHRKLKSNRSKEKFLRQSSQTNSKLKIKLFQKDSEVELGNGNSDEEDHSKYIFKVPTITLSMHDQPLRRKNSSSSQSKNDIDHIELFSPSSVLYINLMENKSTTIDINMPKYKFNLDEFLYDDVPDPVTEDAMEKVKNVSQGLNQSFRINLWQSSKAVDEEQMIGDTASVECIVSPKLESLKALPILPIADESSEDIPPAIHLNTRNQMQKRYNPSPEAFRKLSLPVELSYITTSTFRCLPKWVTRFIAAKTVAILSLVITVTISLINILSFIYFVKK